MIFWKSKKLLVVSLVLILFGLIPFYFLVIEGEDQGNDPGSRSRGPCTGIIKDPQPQEPPSGSPKPFKAIGFDPNNMRDISDIDKAKDMGANVITLFVDSQATNEKVIYFQECIGKNAEEMLGNYINEAHQNGLFVEIREVQAPPTDNVGLKSDKEIAKSYAEFWVEIAKVAEKFGVYQITAFGELDNSYSESHKKELVWTELPGDGLAFLAQEVQKEIRKHYGGRVAIGIGDPRSRWQKPYRSGLDLAGFDQFQFSYYPAVEDTKFTTYFKELPEILSISREIADTNKIPEIVWGESGVTNPDEKLEGFEWGTAVVTEEKEADYYDRLFEESYKKVDGYNAVSIFGFFTVIGEPGEAVVKKWYTQLN